MTRYDTPTNWAPAKERRLSVRLIYWPMWEKVPWWNIRLSWSSRFFMTGPYELRFDYECYMQPTTGHVKVTEQTPEILVIEDVARDWFQAHPLARPRAGKSKVFGVATGNGDMVSLREYVETSIPDNVDVSGAMIQVTLERLVREHEQERLATPWYYRPAKWWQFWLPQSGYLCGLVFAAVGIGAIWSIVRLVRYLFP